MHIAHKYAFYIYVCADTHTTTQHTVTHNNRTPIATAHKTSYNDKNISFVDKKLSFLIIKLLFFDICIFFVLSFCGLLVEKICKLWSIGRKMRKNAILLLFFINFAYLCAWLGV